MKIVVSAISVKNHRKFKKFHKDIEIKYYDFFNKEVRWVRRGKTLLNLIDDIEI